MRLLTVLLLAQTPDRPELRAGLDTLYAGRFETAAQLFAELAAADTTDAAALIFQAAAYIWWGEARDDERFERHRIDSLLNRAIVRGRAARDTFWLATAYGYRARQRELYGGALGAAKDAKRMRDGYAHVLAADSGCVDCYLGLGLYDYGLSRVGGLARFFARLIGLGSGDADRGIRYLRRVAQEGDLAQVEATWVLVSALLREGARDDASDYLERLRVRYPDNPVFQRAP